MIDPRPMILESIVTSKLEDGTMHVAPMGPSVDPAFHAWTLKPFQTSTTFANMRRTGRCIVNVVDDALLLAEAVLGKADHAPASRRDDGEFILHAASHWYALRVSAWDIEQPRAIASCEVIDRGIHRPFFGWNRAKHAIVELAILVSRLHLIDRSAIEIEVAKLKILIEKTAGDREWEAFQLLADYIQCYEGSAH